MSGQSRKTSETHFLDTGGVGFGELPVMMLNKHTAVCQNNQDLSATFKDVKAGVYKAP